MAYETAEVVYAGAEFKTVIPWNNDKFNIFKDKLPNDYYDFLDQIEIVDPTALLSTKYLLFLDSYFYFHGGMPGELDDLSGFDRISALRSYVLAQSSKELTGEVQEIYHRYAFSQIVKYYSDSLQIDSLLSAFGLPKDEPLIAIAGTKSQSNLKPLLLAAGDTIPEFYLSDRLDSLRSIRDFKDDVLYINFWATWCGPCIKNIPQLNKMIDDLSMESSVTFLNVCLDSEKEKWPQVIAKYSLSGINLIAEGRWNDNIRSYFDIDGIPHYAILGKNNVLIENYSNKAPQVQEQLEDIVKTL